MKNWIAGCAVAALWAGSAALSGAGWENARAQVAQAVPERLTVSIDATRTSAPVSRYEYGMFIEHIGGLIYRSLWSEMLDDRKFWYPISVQEPAPVAGPFRGLQPRRWKPVGGDEVVGMDKEDPFVGAQSPRIGLDAATAHGIRQTGIALVKGKGYTGHIWLRATPGAKVSVSLVWGAGAQDRQTLMLARLGAAYAEVPLRFTAGGDTNEGALEITGTGKGNFHVGTVSLMPADNVEGFRPDTIALLRTLHSGFWRLPGGNFLSDWNWYDGLGDRDRRPPMFDYAWNAMQTNDVGLDEFMTLCRLIGTEPYITVNAGFGDAHSAGEEVEYMNGAVTTRLGALRAKNGHPEPYHVRFWDIGNEPYGAWQLGRTDLKYYVLKDNEFAAAMRRADPSITLLASGSMVEDMNYTGAARTKYVGNLEAAYGTEDDWTGGLLAHSWGNFDGITEHWYAQSGRRFDMQKAKTLPLDAPTDAGYDKVDQTPLEYARYPANIVHLKAQEWEGYEQRFPAMLDKKTFLSIDEYAYLGGSFNRAPDLKLALAYGMVFNEMLRHTDFLTMSAHTMGVSTLDYTPTAATINAVGLLFRLYGDQFGAGSIPVAVSGNSPQPAPQYPIGGDQPRTNSGSPTYPLDMVAALSPDRKFLTVAVVNATETAQKFDLDVSGVQLNGSGRLWQLTGNSLEAANRVGQAPQVEVRETPIGEAKTLTAARISVNVYRLAVGR